jgi:hypothetical protein
LLIFHGSTSAREVAGAASSAAPRPPRPVPLPRLPHRSEARPVGAAPPRCTRASRRGFSRRRGLSESCPLQCRDTRSGAGFSRGSRAVAHSKGTARSSPGPSPRLAPWRPHFDAGLWVPEVSGPTSSAALRSLHPVLLPRLRPAAPLHMGRVAAARVRHRRPLQTAAADASGSPGSPRLTEGFVVRRFLDHQGFLSRSGHGTAPGVIA